MSPLGRLDGSDRDALVHACRQHGIDDSFTGIDGITREVPTETLAALAEALRIEEAAPVELSTIEDALHEHDPPHIFVPPELRNNRVWGFACQLGSLRSDRNAGIGDFADLEALVRVLADLGADFVGLNPLHALFSADPGRVSPFSPSNRMFLNAFYIALDRVEGFERLPERLARVPDELRDAELIDHVAVQRYKNEVLDALYYDYPWTRELRGEFDAFKRREGEPLRDHAVFGALSRNMAARGSGAGWTQWPLSFRDRQSVDVKAFETAEPDAVEYHMWLQWQADRQLARAAQAAKDAGMRVGLYLDLAVGAAPDGSATWSEPATVVPGLHVGAPPDPFSDTGQDWGLAPISPVAMAETDARPIETMMRAVMRHAGAVRVDHAMGLARLWLIPAGRPALEGAYVRYPLKRSLAALARTSHDKGCMVIGEDLGVVPEGFRPLMERREMHAYKVFLFERDHSGFRDPRSWNRCAMACVGTHDTPSFPGWWAGHDIDVRQAIGWLDEDAAGRERWIRGEQREEVRAVTGDVDDVETSVRIHAHVARSPCRLMVCQIDDALGTLDQPNLPGSMDEHPNWRRRMSVPVNELANHDGLARHAAALRAERPR